MSNRYVQIDPRDNLIVAIHDLKEGESVCLGEETFTIKQNIPAKHKFSLVDLKEGDQAFMYGVLVGEAIQTINRGEAITVQNLQHASTAIDQRNKKTDWSKPDISKFKDRTFKGYHRKDGKVGTGNYWLVLPLTFCENRNIDVLKTALTEALGYSDRKEFSVDTAKLVDMYKSGKSENEILAEDVFFTDADQIKNRVFPNVDGVKFLKHEGGCGGTREDAEALCHLMAGYITHPNVAGATVLSLGCQNAEPQILQGAIEKRDSDFSKPLHILQQQGTLERDYIAKAVKLTFAGLMEANKIQRKPASIKHLVLGLECGGSDGFSGISANPALGYASDLLASLGGSPVLAEFPELNGVEQELIDRCIEDKDAEKFASIMKTYGEQAIAVGSGFKNNPSPGNIKDGLITDAMKSAGAAKKGGTSPVVDVLDYTEPVTKPGLSLLCTPGNDVESTTALVGSWANVVVFTTGLGTPTGNPIAPVIKVSSNNSLSGKMKDIIDVNAGTVISGEDTIQTKGEEILDYVIKVASGELMSKAMKLGQDDFIPWKRGISL